MASTVSADFKYEIGDIMCIRGAVRLCAFERVTDHVRAPSAWIVTGRIVNQCHGGTQWMYQVSLEGTLRNVFEYELTPYEPIEIVKSINDLCGQSGTPNE